MRKHSVIEHEKLSSVYLKELFPPMLCAMADFLLDGWCFVPLAHSNVNVYTQNHGNDPIDLIFPLHQVWKQKQSDPEVVIQESQLISSSTSFLQIMLLTPTKLVSSSHI